MPTVVYEQLCQYYCTIGGETVIVKFIRRDGDKFVVRYKGINFLVYPEYMGEKVVST